ATTIVRSATTAPAPGLSGDDPLPRSFSLLIGIIDTRRPLPNPTRRSKNYRTCDRAGGTLSACVPPLRTCAAALHLVAMMNEVTRILSAIEQGDPSAAEQLLPLVYDELRRLAAQRLAQEKPGQTLEATALVHEAYLRLVGGDTAPSWNSRGHFFAAAAEA